MAITSFRGKYNFLSNFHPCTVTYNGLTYLSTEAAFQAEKTLDLNEKQRFTTMTAAESKQEGKKVTLRADWEEAKLTIMEDLLRLKFNQSNLKKKLLETGDEELVEGNYWHDKYWGQCPVGTGENHLGRLLMKIREELKNV